MRNSRFFSNKMLRLVLFFVLLNLTGCVVADAVLWLPRKIGNGTMALWDATAGKVFATPEKNNKWQEELVLGPRRKPSANPGTSGWNGGENEQTVATPSARSRQMPTPSPYGGASGGAMMPPKGGMVIPYPSAMGGQGSMGGMPGGYDDPGSMGGPMGGGMDPSGGMGMPMGGGYPTPPSPYGSGGNAGPYDPGNHKFVRKFEPMAAEFSKDEKGQVYQAKFEPTDLDVVMEQGKKPAKHGDKNSMFPIEEYKPKSDIAETAMSSSPSSYPKLGTVPDKPVISKEELNSKVDSLMNDLDNANKHNSIMQFEDKKDNKEELKIPPKRQKVEPNGEDSSDIRNNGEDYDASAMGLADLNTGDQKALAGGREEQERELAKKMEKLELSSEDSKKRNVDSAVLGKDKAEKKGVLSKVFNKKDSDPKESQRKFEEALDQNKNLGNNLSSTKVVMEKAANDVRRPINKLSEIPEQADIPVPAQIIGKASTNQEDGVPPPPNVVLPKISDDGVVAIYNKNPDIYTGVLPKSRYAGRRNASE